MNGGRMAHAAAAAAPAEESEAVSLSERLLRYARNGEADMIRSLLADATATSGVDVNCRGKDMLTLRIVFLTLSHYA